MGPTILPQTEGRLLDNIVHFARALRKAGVTVGTSQVQTAIEAVQRAGFTKRLDFYYTLRATLIMRPEHLQTYHQVFHLFWRDPEYLERMMKMMLPLLQTLNDADEPAPKAAERRGTEALMDAHPPPNQVPEREEVELEARFSQSDTEILRGMDFEQMSVVELAQATKAIRDLRLPIAALKTRRFKPAHHGSKPDISRMMRRSLRRGGEVDRLLLKRPQTRPPTLVALCDISGSMSTYARMMMHFLHALVWAPQRDWGKVHGFTFGTQLTNVTRALHLKDPDLALAAAGQDAPDWQGGTRIGAALHRFNRDWSRRVLGQGAVVLLITDGLECGDAAQLEREVERLALSCHRLIWLNPLLRWDEFSPKAQGIRMILPKVDSFYGCHSLNSLAQISQTLNGPGEKQRLMRML